MIDYKLIPATDHIAWMEILQFCGIYDIYHLPQYHLMAEEMGEGVPYLFSFQMNGLYAAFPFLLRPISNVKWLETCRYNDVTSVYGYPGVVTLVKEDSVDAGIFRLAFQQALLQIFDQLSIVSFFSRTNPLLHNTWIFKGMAELLPLSMTIAIDLSSPEKEQLQGISKGHKCDIRKGRNLGIVVEEDVYFQFIDEFIFIYNETMRRNQACEKYFFLKDYYLYLKINFGESVKLYFAKLDGQAISAAMFFMSGKIIQYHLSGTLSEYLFLNGAKLILDEVRKIGKENGFTWLHLGGGVGSSEDSLYRFKAGFSKVRQTYEVVRMIINQEKYDELLELRFDIGQNIGDRLLDKNYFPAYRLPL